MTKNSLTGMHLVLLSFHPPLPAPAWKRPTSSKFFRAGKNLLHPQTLRKSELRCWKAQRSCHRRCVLIRICRAGFAKQGPRTSSELTHLLSWMSPTPSVRVKSNKSNPKPDQPASAVLKRRKKGSDSTEVFSKAGFLEVTLTQRHRQEPPDLQP